MSERPLVTPLIEDELPKQLIYDLGLYIQTCAHIEFAACSVICAFEEYRTGNKSSAERFNQLRKLSTSDLIKELRRSGVGANYGDFVSSGDFEIFVNWIERYKINRHIAVHGAFHRDKHGQLFASYVQTRKNKKKPELLPENIEITRARTKELIADADRILRMLVTLGMHISNSAEIE